MYKNVNKQKYEPEEYLLLSGIQHFVFCRRQWALIHIEQQWSENGLTAEGRAIHKRVHNDKVVDKRDGVLTIRGMQVKSAMLGVTGICDAVEFFPDESGIKLSKYEGLWRPRPIEYKHGEEKNDDCDILQVTAQAMCLEEMMCCNIMDAAIYYNNTHSRQYIKLTQELKDKVTDMFEEMHGYYRKSYTPKARFSKSCANCSLKEFCLPKLTNSKMTVADYIKINIESGYEL